MENNNLTLVQQMVVDVCENVKNMLIEKNRKYGNAALDPLRIFSVADPVEQLRVRIDDKLSRIAEESYDEDEDVVMDLIGYLVLLKVAEHLDDPYEDCEDCGYRDCDPDGKYYCHCECCMHDADDRECHEGCCDEDDDDDNDACGNSCTCCKDKGCCDSSNIDIKVPEGIFFKSIKTVVNPVDKAEGNRLFAIVEKLRSGKKPTKKDLGYLDKLFDSLKDDADEKSN